MANNWCTLCNATAKRYDRHYTDLIFINFEELERIQEEDISFDNPISADVWIIQSVNNLVSQITGSGEKQTIKEEYKNDVIELFKKLENNAALIGVKYEFALQKALSNFPNLNNYNLEFVKSATTLEIFIRHLDPRLEKLYQYVIESNLLPPLHHFASTKPENFKNKIDTYRDLPSSMRSLKLIKDLLL